jgi:DNA-binding PadR family transcriptional regulator
MLDDVLELAVLGVLKEAELHGYELKKRLREVLGPLSSVSFGSLYPALNRLERSGLVKAVDAEDAPAPAPSFPSTGSFKGEAAAFRTTRLLGASRAAGTRGPRGKKVYGITEAGQARLAELLAQPADDDRGFALQLAFCRWCEPADRITLLRRRRDVLGERLREGRRRSITTDRYLRSLVEHDTESTERDIAWLDRLIDEELASSPEPHTPDTDMPDTDMPDTDMPDPHLEDVR